MFHLTFKSHAESLNVGANSNEIKSKTKMK